MLYRPLQLGSSATLSFTLYYTYEAGVFCTLPNLKYNDGCNQQYRVDILREGANPFSTSSDDVLMTLYQTQPGDPSTMAPFFNASVDDVKLVVNN